MADADGLRNIAHCQRKVKIGVHVVDGLLDVPRRRDWWMAVEPIDQAMGHLGEDQLQGGFRQQSHRLRRTRQQFTA